MNPLDGKLTTLEGLWFVGQIGMIHGGFGGSKPVIGQVESAIGENSYLGKLTSGSRVVLHLAAISDLRFFENHESLKKYIEDRRAKDKARQEKFDKLQEEMRKNNQTESYPIGFNAPLMGVEASEGEFEE